MITYNFFNFNIKLKIYLFLFSLYEKDEVRALFVLLQCPVFGTQSSAPIFAHLLNYIAQLSKDDHQLLVHWFRM